MPEKSFSIDKWTKEFPTVENEGQWFVVNMRGILSFREIRKDEDGILFLCEACHEGIQKRSYGIPLHFFKKGCIQFAGPIQMPKDYRKL